MKKDKKQTKKEKNYIKMRKYILSQNYWCMIILLSEMDLSVLVRGGSFLNTAAVQQWDIVNTKEMKIYDNHSKRWTSFSTSSAVQQLRKSRAYIWLL
jgi:hypothetical protein